MSSGVGLAPNISTRRILAWNTYVTHVRRKELAMKLLIQSAMIFFGTLMAAAVVALGEPARSDDAAFQSGVSSPQSRSAASRHDGTSSQFWPAIGSLRGGFGLR
jgi:hypothetical protein